VNIFTIGFTGKTAEEFFSLVGSANIKKLIDIRINRSSQMSGFAKEKDLGFFLEKLNGIEYVVNEELAPTKSLLSEYRERQIDWSTYSLSYLELLSRRSILSKFNQSYFDNSVLLCSEKAPIACHRVLLADFLKSNFNNVEIVHLT
jgi:uncharacterized protein (DUF488 family)